MIDGTNITATQVILTIVSGPIFVLVYAFTDQYFKDLKKKKPKQNPLLFL